MKNVELLAETVGVPQTLALLETEADARRARLSDNLEELAVRMRPRNIVAEMKEAAWAEVDRVTDEFLNVASDLVDDSVEWVKENRTVVAGGALTGLLAAAAVWYLSRRTTVPLYAAYDMEDPDMMNETEETLGEKANEAWGKVKEEAQHLGEKAEGAYYAARSKAAVLSDSAREQAAHAAEVARERAHEAAEAAREAAERAREAAVEAGRWAKKQPQDNPATVILAALAAGAVIGALLPASGRRRA
ncbi:DUF3618 domain-containing protein [Sandaracinobacter sp. RS1-74]|uniref:DUF3618 domain-containing protein n=1 Tax=Sandaracinobacteroides sayramensis TaxID=2913411 RepID=UPI001EDA87B0|nr:DUF3618 domain-containing protein [Sandaracinobacteroides sayramensis]MCG2841341.1 DUF3618 domain-containing protein [Sandaracinobacteroides sayramensis]